MKLTRLEIQFLKRAKANKDKTMKLRHLFTNNLKKYCILFIYLGSLFTLFIFLDPSYIVSTFFFGLFIGIISRDLGIFRILIRLNPISLAITDWKKIDELLKNNEQN